MYRRERPKPRTEAPPPAPEAAPSNRALAAMLAREVGWRGAGKGKPNSEQRRVEAPDASRAVERIPIDGIKGTGLPSRAIVVMPSLPSGRDTVDVLLHLHGFTPGYAGAKPADLAGYNIEAQMAAAGKDLIAILPQGDEVSDFNPASAAKSFDSDTFIKAVFARLTEEGFEPPAPGRVILSSHSGGDQSIVEMLKSSKAPAKLAGLFLFDTMIAESFGGAVADYVDARINREVDHLRLARFSPADPALIEAESLAWLRENGFRVQIVYRKGGAYEAAAKAIGARLEQHFAAVAKDLTPGVLQALRDHFHVHEITDIKRIGHMDVLAGDDAFQHAIESLPTEDAALGLPYESQPLPADAIDTPQLMRLASHAGNRAMGRLLARDPTPTATEIVTTTIRWNTTQPPRNYLKDTFTDHPVDWKADVYVDGKKEGSGDGTLDLKLVKGSKHVIKVVPTPADKRDDFYSTASKKVTADAVTVDVPLAYHRENQYFTDQSWEHQGIDPVKARDTTSATMLDHAITVNKKALPTVKKTNEYFASNALTDDERAEVKKTTLVIGGYNRRTTSDGDFSNHSTGCAVDINVNEATSQNLHWKDSKPELVKRMELFSHVVQKESGWSSWSGWNETDGKKWLEASRLFNVHFPRFLAELLDDAAGTTDNTALADMGEALDWFGGTQAVGVSMVTSQDPGKLRKAAAAAKKKGKADSAKWLERTATDWTAVRAWIEGVVMYDAEHWAYISDHEARAAAGKEKRKPVGELHGMIALHPKLVETLVAGGWSWLINFQHAKDLMHFEDRAAYDQIKK
jgi:hypothetical protein